MIFRHERVAVLGLATAQYPSARAVSSGRLAAASCGAAAGADPVADTLVGRLATRWALAGFGVRPMGAAGGATGCARRFDDCARFPTAIGRKRALRKEVSDTGQPECGARGRPSRLGGGGWLGSRRRRSAILRSPELGPTGAGWPARLRVARRATAGMRCTPREVQRALPRWACAARRRTADSGALNAGSSAVSGRRTGAVARIGLLRQGAAGWMTGCVPYEPCGRATRRLADSGTTRALGCDLVWTLLSGSGRLARASNSGASTRAAGASQSAQLYG